MRGVLAGLALCAGLMTGGCPQTVQVKTPFDPTSAAFINAKGRAMITGQAFLRRNDGVVVYAAGSEVALIPATAYAEERMQAQFRGGKMASGPSLQEPQIEGDDPRYFQHRRIAKANGEGRFQFADVAPGNYFVTARVQWSAYDPQIKMTLPQGGVLMDRITISGSERAELVLNGQ